MVNPVGIFYLAATALVVVVILILVGAIPKP